MRGYYVGFLRPPPPRGHLDVVSEMGKLRSHITLRIFLYMGHLRRRSRGLWFWRGGYGDTLRDRGGRGGQSA